MRVCVWSHEMGFHSIIIEKLQHVSTGWSWPCTAVHGQDSRHDCVSEIWRRSLNQFFDLGFRFVAKRFINALILETKYSDRKRITHYSTRRSKQHSFMRTGDEVHDTSSNIVISHIMCSVRRATAHDVSDDDIVQDHRSAHSNINPSIYQYLFSL